MSLGRTFTNSIVREIGRNYDKAISNSLMGDSHSTPVRMVGGDVSRMRGRTYRNKLDEAIEKFTVKGTVATFNAGINIPTQYCSLVEESKDDTIVAYFFDHTKVFRNYKFSVSYGSRPSIDL